MKIDSLTPSYFQATPKEAVQTPELSFGQWMGEKVEQTNDQLVHADTALQELARGNTDNLHQTMLTLEEAKLSFQYMEQIRNRLMSAYQELLREQI